MEINEELFFLITFLKPLKFVWDLPIEIFREKWGKGALISLLAPGARNPHYTTVAFTKLLFKNCDWQSRFK